MATATEPQQIPAGQSAVLPQTTAAPPSYDSLQFDQQKQQLSPGQQQQIPVQQGAPFQGWSQGQVQYQQPMMGAPGFPNQRPVQYIVVSDHLGHGLKSVLWLPVFNLSARKALKIYSLIFFFYILPYMYGAIIKKK